MAECRAAVALRPSGESDMQSADAAYVEQIPAGARPPAGSAAPPPLLRGSGPRSPPPPRSAPAGLYVQVASVPGPREAVQAALEVTDRLGAQRPAFVRGVKVVVNGTPRIRLYAGPLADEPAARRLCAAAIPGQPCLLQRLDAEAQAARDPVRR